MESEKECVCSVCDMRRCAPLETSNFGWSFHVTLLRKSTCTRLRNSVIFWFKWTLENEPLFHSNLAFSCKVTTFYRHFGQERKLRVIWTNATKTCRLGHEKHAWYNINLLDYTVICKKRDKPTVCCCRLTIFLRIQQQSHGLARTALQKKRARKRSFFTWIEIGARSEGLGG